jgi:ferredoxin/flavodoxin---NADP+ reductase
MATAFFEETVLKTHHWTPQLFSFQTTRNPAFRFSNGHFVMLGLKVGDKPLLRAYSVASADYEEQLEFFSIKVADGPLTSKLQHLQPGDKVLVGRKPTGSLVIEQLEPGGRLWLLATGTGLAPFLSIIRDPATYERFAQVILVHGVRHVADLAYRDFIERELPEHPLVGEFVPQQLRYIPTVTREPFPRQGRITELLDNGSLAAEVGATGLTPTHDRVMICGGPGMLRDLKTRMESYGLQRGNSHHQGQYVIEAAFAEG